MVDTRFSRAEVGKLEQEIKRLKTEVNSLRSSIKGINLRGSDIPNRSPNRGAGRRSGEKAEGVRRRRAKRKG